MIGDRQSERRSPPAMLLPGKLPSDLPAVGPGQVAILDVGRTGTLIAIETRFDQAWRAAKGHLGQLHRVGFSPLEMIRDGCLSGAADLLLFTDRHGLDGVTYGAGVAMVSELDGKRYVIAPLDLRRSVKDLTAFGDFLAFSGGYVAVSGVCIATPRRVRFDRYKVQFDQPTNGYGYSRDLAIVQ
jgi:hypothetical protein